MTRLRLAGVASAALLVGALGACKPAPPAVDTGKISDTVKADVAQLVTDFNAHDAAKAVSQDAPGMVSMFHGTPNTVGPDADLAVTKQQVADPLAKVTVSDESVDVAAAGDMAIYRATYVYNFTDPKTKKPTTEDGNWLIAFKPQADGTWKIIWNVISDTPPAPAAAKAS